MNNIGLILINEDTTRVEDIVFAPPTDGVFPFIRVRWDRVLEYQCTQMVCGIRKNDFGAMCEKCGFRVYSRYAIKWVPWPRKWPPGGYFISNAGSGDILIGSTTE